MSKVSADPLLNVPKRNPHNEQRDGRHLKEEVKPKNFPSRDSRRLADTPSGTYDASKLVAQSIVNRGKFARTRKIVTLGVPQDTMAGIKKRANSAKADRAKAAKQVSKSKITRFRAQKDKR